MNPSPYESRHQSASNSRSPLEGNSPNFMIDDPQFDIVEWYPAYQSCQRYFVNHAQHAGLVQAVASFVNIRLPVQWTTNTVWSMPPALPPPVSGSSRYVPPPGGYGAHFQRGPPGSQPSSLPFVSLIPFIRRLVVTGFDTDGVMHGFFGDDWQKGVGSLHEIERRNYLFAAKSVGWAQVKQQYDMSPEETVPFIKPLQRVQLAEIEAAEKNWSEWLAMEDWMIGPRSPDEMGLMSTGPSRRYGPVQATELRESTGRADPSRMDGPLHDTHQL